MKNVRVVLATAAALTVLAWPAGLITAAGAATQAGEHKVPVNWNVLAGTKQKAWLP
jgi:hypothetical protein